MEVDEDRCYKGYVLNEADSYLFFMVIEEGFCAVIHRNISAVNKIQVGDFAVVKIRKTKNLKKNWRAKHFVYYYRPIEPLAPIILTRGYKTSVAIITTAVYDGLVSYNNKKIKRYRNDIFGYFFDLNCILTKAFRKVTFEFKSEKSPLQNCLSIFIIIKVLDINEESEIFELKRVQSRNQVSESFVNVKGLVGSRENQGYFVWTKTFGDVFLPIRYSDAYESIFGRWISMSILKDEFDHFSVCRPVELIRDKLETRTKYGIAEIFVQFQYMGIKDNGYPLFLNDEIGEIVDISEIVVDLNRSSKYYGWVARQKRNDTNIQWKISPNQPLISRYRDSENCESRSLKVRDFDYCDTRLGYNECKQNGKMGIKNERYTTSDETSTSSLTSTNTKNAGSRNRKNPVLTLAKENKEMKALMLKLMQSSNVVKEMKLLDDEAYNELENILNKQNHF